MNLNMYIQCFDWCTEVLW